MMQRLSNLNMNKNTWMRRVCLGVAYLCVILQLVFFTIVLQHITHGVKQKQPAVHHSKYIRGVAHDAQKEDEEPLLKKKQITNDQDNTCTVYMAPSSVRGIKSMGIYTTKDLSRGSVIVKAADGLSIPVIDYYNDVGDTEQTKLARKKWISIFDEYWWGRGVTDQLRLEADTAVDFKMTFGELPNHHCVLDSLDLLNPHKGYNDGLVNRTIDPGVGAFSYHVGRKVIVNRQVSAGEELFLNYGHCYENNGHKSVDWEDNIVKNKDFSIAARITGKLWNEIMQYDGGNDLNKRERKERLEFFGTYKMKHSVCVALMK